MKEGRGGEAEEDPCAELNRVCLPDATTHATASTGTSTEASFPFALYKACVGVERQQRVFPWIPFALACFLLALHPVTKLSINWVGERASFLDPGSFSSLSSSERVMSESSSSSFSIFSPPSSL